MATSTILEPIRVNDEHGAEVIVEALENAENMNYRRNAGHSVALTTDSEAIRKVTAKAMEGGTSRMISAVISIENMLDTYGEEATEALLSTFSCVRGGVQKNEEVETFVKKNVIDFFRRKLAVTYLAFDENSDFVGIYTLAHKAIDIPADRLSTKLKNKVKRYARLDEEQQTYSVSAFLIAQFGKNYEENKGRTISGSELMDSALGMLSVAQAIVSGGLIFLDCEVDNAAALELYEKYGFVPFGERKSESDGHRYIQLLKGF